MRSAMSMGACPDANAPLSRGLAALCIRLTAGGGAHTADEFIETAPLEKGMEQLLQFVRDVWGIYSDQ